MSDKKINYDHLIQEALRSVIVQLLKNTEQNGLPGKHYFRVSFLPYFEDVMCPDYLAIQHQNGLSIEIQEGKYQNLKVAFDKFSIDLYINEQTEHFIVPFRSITHFVDPHVQFGLEFEDTLEENKAEKVKEDFEEQKTANVVSLEAFRKKKQQ